MNVFQYAAITEANWERNLAEMSGYERKYTFYSDFSIAEFCEVYKQDNDAVVDTYNRVVEAWGKDIKAMSEVVMVLNHKLWSFYGSVDSSYLGCSEEWKNHFLDVYNDLYERCVNFVEENFGENAEAMEYYFSVTD